MEIRVISEALELYYLQTRYYDPTVCRFISPDHPDYLDYESINGLNLYAYCLNNPVMYCDPTGHSWESFWNSTAGKILGTVLVIGATVALSIATAGIGTAVTTALGGGFFAAVAGGAVGGAISGAIFGVGISMVTQGTSNGYANIDYGKVGIEGLVGMASGALTGAIFAGVGRGLGLLGKTKWAQRTLDYYDDVSKNYMFGSNKGRITDSRYTVGDCDTCKTTAIKERAIADSRYAVGYRDTCKTTAIRERTFV